MRLRRGIVLCEGPGGRAPMPADSLCFHLMIKESIDVRPSQNTAPIVDSRCADVAGLRTSKVNSVGFSRILCRFMDIQERPASRTAIGVAVLRAMHELYDDSPKI